MADPNSPSDLAQNAGGAGGFEKPYGSEERANPGLMNTPVIHRIGRFVILRVLGEGGMGIVYSAYDEQLDRKVAVKFLYRSKSEPGARRARALPEAQAMARVSHPNVLQVYEVGEVSGQVFIAMEFVEGMTLANWQSQSERTWEEILSVYRAAGQGLLAAHRAGLVHRDFKPDNVLVDKEGRPRVADFGLARFADTGTPAHTPNLQNLRKLPAKLPVPIESLVGTPAYMSPEQYLSERVDNRSDQFSFCAALYEALYKVPAFEGEEIDEIGCNILLGNVRPVPQGTQIPSTIEQALRRGLSIDPGNRFASMEELLAALDIDPQRDPAAAPRTRRAFIAAMLVMVTLRSLYVLVRRDSPSPVQDMLAGAIFICVTALTVTWILRRELQRNAFHRDMVAAFIAISLQIIGMRAVGLLLDLTPPQLVSVDLVALSGLFSLVAWQYLPPLWVVPPFCMAGAVLSALRPALTWWLVQLGYPLLMILLFLAWTRAARRMAARNTGRGNERVSTTLPSLGSLFRR